VSRARQGLRFALASFAAALLLASTASGYTTADGYSARDYATGFPSAELGPLGVAFDNSDNLYVGDPTDQHIYRFQPGGGVADSNTRLTSAPIPGFLAGFAFTRDGRLYAALKNAGAVVELDQATGAIKRTVASGIACATGLASDPLSNDLFVSQNTCTPHILRISDFADGRGQVSRYATSPCCVDGLAFGPDGTLYAASGESVLAIDGTSSSTAGAARTAALVPNGDGVAVGVPGEGESPFVFVNRTDGIVTRVDFSATPPAQRDIFTDGTRGDFVAVDSRGCLYITQTSSIVRVTPSGRRCELSPTTPGAGGEAAPAPGITVDVVSGQARNRKCLVRNRLAIRVRQRGRIRLKRVAVYVRGKYRKTVRNRRVTAPIVIRRVPRGKFTVKLVARTAKGRKLKAKKRFRNCQPRLAPTA
jgi:hypothetical protein